MSLALVMLLLADLADRGLPHNHHKPPGLRATN